MRGLTFARAAKVLPLKLLPDHSAAVDGWRRACLM